MARRVPSEPPIVRGYGGGSTEEQPVRLLPFVLWLIGFALLVATGTCGDVEDPTGPRENAVEMR